VKGKVEGLFKSLFSIHLGAPFLAVIIP